MENQDPMVVAPADGVVRGDSKGMPNKGTGTGFTGVGDDRYGADVSQGATNRLGPANGTSDPAMLDVPKGDEDRFNASGHAHTDPGTGMGGAANSDPQGEDKAKLEDSKQ